MLFIKMENLTWSMIILKMQNSRLSIISPEEGEGCMEAVKIYYFAAHYQLSLENVEYDTDWGDMCN